MLLNQVITIKDSISSSINETSGRMLSILTLLETEEIPDLSRKRALDDLIRSANEYRHVFVFLPSSSIIMDSGTDHQYIEHFNWWKPYTQKIKRNQTDSFQGNYNIAIATDKPFRDEMNLNTILPVSYSLLSGVSVSSMAFIEFDLTKFMMTAMEEFNLVLLDKRYPLEISVYDKNGLLLESSRNIPKSTIEVPTPTAGEILPFNDKRFYKGAIFTQDKTHVQVFVRNTQLGLIFSGTLPVEVITSSAKNTAIFILVIGLFCELAVLGLGLILLNTYHRMKHYETLQAEARFENLQNKMNPHFLFNTLDSIVGVAENKDYSVLVDMLRYLSWILHVNLRISSNFITLSDEIQYIQSYIALQKIRYKDCFSFDLQVNVECDSMNVLRFCLQPVIENCFVHAVALRNSFVKIEMKIYQKQDYLICDVMNTGSSSTDKKILIVKERLKKIGREEKTPRLGLVSIHNRLRILYGENFGIEIPKESRGLTVRIIMPILD